MMSDFFAYLAEMMAQDAGLFQGWGTTQLKAFLLIAIVLFGLKSMLGHGFEFAKFIDLMLLAVLALTLMRFYGGGLPFVGLSVPQLIMREGTWMAAQVGGASLETVMRDIDGSYAGMTIPMLSVLNVLLLIKYVIMAVLLMLAEAMIYAVIGFGYVAAAVCALAGPIFLPWIMVPSMDWLFWGWFKAFLQYAVGYPVVAALYIKVFGNLLTHFIQLHPPPYDGG